MRADADREEHRGRNHTFYGFLRTLAPLAPRTLLEIGAACGGNVPYFISWGFSPEHITLNELRIDHATRATHLFPGVRMLVGDAAELRLEPHDVVVASTVFSSILSDRHRSLVAEAMWRLTKPGGAVLIYDFTWNNPLNPAVRKFTIGQIRDLFPHGRLHVKRVTLAPPLARRLPCRIRRALHRVPWLRTHIVAWLTRADESAAAYTTSEYRGTATHGRGDK